MLKPIYGLWLRDVMKFSRSKWKILSGLSQPMLYLVVMGMGMDNVFRAAGYGSYSHFISPGVVGMSVILASFINGFSVLWDKKFGFLKETLVSPAARWQLVVGKSLGSSTTATIQATIVLGLVFLVTGDVPSLSIFALTILSIFSIGFMFATLGVACGSLLDDFQSIQFIISFILMPLIFLSGALFPIHGNSANGYVLSKISMLNPVSYSIDLIRHAMGNGGNFDLLTSCVICFAFLAVVFMIALRSFSRIEAT